LMVWDLGTRSGTLVNGVRVSPKAPLRSGDELSFGKHRFVAQYHDGSARPRPAEIHARGSAASSAPPRRRRQPTAQV